MTAMIHAMTDEEYYIEVRKPFLVIWPGEGKMLDDPAWLIARIWCYNNILTSDFAINYRTFAFKYGEDATLFKLMHV